MSDQKGMVLKIIRTFDTIGNLSGKIFSWMILPLMGGLTYEVIARYAFNAPTLWAYDLSYMIYGSLFMLGAGYCLLNKGHIRCDFFYQKLPPRKQGLIDAICYLSLFFPGMIFFFIVGWESAYYSLSIREVSEASPWRPPIYPFKMVIPISAVLLMLQGISEVLKSIWALRHGEWI